MAGANYGFTTTDTDKDLIARLPARYQQALAWTGSDETVATQESVPVGTIKSRRNRARNALRAARAALDGG